jgi:NTP pyrophosphatase (non-canonical NTP hydrolase)
MTNELAYEAPKRKVIEFPQDCASALSAVALHSYKVAQISGFHDNDDDLQNGRFGDFCANLHGEVSELWEAYRKGNLNKQCDKPVDMTCAAEELADIVIRAFDTAVTLGIDIGDAIYKKDAYNQTRAFKHGDKRA